MINMKTALYIGRFQPFHLGHLSVVEKISKEYDQIVIAIGSAQECMTKRNPFSYVERWFMIEDTLKVKGISNYRIIPVPDIRCPEKWADFTNAIFGDYDVVITNDANTKILFEKRGDKVECVKPKQIEIDSGITEIHGTMIREMISKRDYRYTACVHAIVIEYLWKIKACDKLEEIWNG